MKLRASSSQIYACGARNCRDTLGERSWQCAVNYTETFKRSDAFACGAIALLLTWLHSWVVAGRGVVTAGLCLAACALSSGRRATYLQASNPLIARSTTICRDASSAHQGACMLPAAASVRHAQHRLDHVAGV
jgi:hypothetical protein